VLDTCFPQTLHGDIAAAVGLAFFPLQQADLLPAPEFLAWNVKNVFEAPARQTPAATPPAAR